MDATKPILGLEPLIFYSGCTVACMGASLLLMGTLFGDYIAWARHGLLAWANCWRCMLAANASPYHEAH